ncbi:MAG: DNA-directed DNA polymerase II small subunit [Halodesulfurarchaeum sp.]|nr:DNA-directed DNA polymerase II small subunit [Halodesulfurarchaeum sp.]
MPRSSPVRIVKRLTAAGLNADREAVTLLAAAADPDRAVSRLIDRMDDQTVTVTTADVRPVLDNARVRTDESTVSNGTTGPDNTTVSGGGESTENHDTATVSTPEMMGGNSAETSGHSDQGPSRGTSTTRNTETSRNPESPAITGDVTGESTGTGVYEDFVSVFRDRYERLSAMLRGRVNHRPTDALESMDGGADAALIGMVTDVRSTRNGHWLIDLEDTNGTFPALVMKDREFAGRVDELLLDEVIAVEGTLADDSGIIFADQLYFPDVPRTFTPSTADRHVQAALVSDLHVGSQEFLAEAWSRFTDWLHGPAGENVEYLLIAGDMVEGVGVYPDQDEELDVVDIFEQYEQFAEQLKAVPGDMEIVMIPGNHDAVRLAEPQPAFEPELREIMTAHDATITGNPSTVELEGVSVLMYHGVSLDELVAELPLESVSYERPAGAMAQLVKKRHLAPKFGGKNRIAPEKRDYLVIEDLPDVVHSGHVHKLGVDGYQGVRLINSGCFQGQTAFQRSVNIEPDTGTVPILSLDTLDVTVRKFT